MYIGDVPVESSYHGSALLYRILQDYPPDLLRVLEGSLCRSLPERRLRGVAYQALQIGSARLAHSRFHKLHSLWLSLRSVSRTGQVRRLLGSFKPEAVVTVAHGHSWVTAAAFARREGIPLHLIVHDDWPRMIALPGPFGERVERQFRRVYRSATSRLCVSPFMRDSYRERYQSDGEVLYPSRARDCMVFDKPPERVLTNKAGLVVAFAGTVSSGGSARLLISLAESLRRRNGTLIIFGPADSMAAWGLVRPNVRFAGLVASNDLIRQLRCGADVLFVPMSFDGIGHEENMRLSFPSKLTDYTATGLPLLISGPDYCSAVQWACQHRPVAEVVTSESADLLDEALQRLSAPQHRTLLANRALEVGNECFSHTRGAQIFAGALRHGIRTRHQVT